MNKRALTALAAAGIHGASMRPILPQQRVLVETAETLAIAIAGAVSFTLLNLPAAFISGSVIFVERAVEHRFVDITEDLTVLVFFAPPEGPQT